MTKSFTRITAACAFLLALAAAGCGTGQIGTPIPGQDRPVVSQLVAVPSVLPAGGGNTTLSWVVSGADTVSVDHGVGAVTGSSAPVSVTARPTFTLTATNAAGSVTQSVGVLVGDQAPLIASFSANPATLPAGGGTTTLSWSVAGADSLSIAPNVGTVTGSSI